MAELVESPTAQGKNRTAKKKKAWRRSGVVVQVFADSSLTSKTRRCLRTKTAERDWISRSVT